MARILFLFAAALALAQGFIAPRSALIAPRSALSPARRHRGSRPHHTHAAMCGDAGLLHPRAPVVRLAAKASGVACSAWVALRQKRAGRAGNPERNAAVPIKCPWPFVLVAVPWTRLGRRSLAAGLCDWQTWAVVALLFLGL